MTEQQRRIGVYVCHCGGNISDYVDVDEVVAAVRGEPGVVVARQTTCSPAPTPARGDHGRTSRSRSSTAWSSRPARPSCTRHHLPRRRQARRAEPVPVHPGQRPRAVLVDRTPTTLRHDRQGHPPRQGRHRPDAPDRAAGADGRGDDAADARHRRRRRRTARGHRPRRHRPRRVPRRTRAAARRLGRELRGHVPARQEWARARRRAQRDVGHVRAITRLHRGRDGQQGRHLRQLPGRHRASAAPNPSSSPSRSGRSSSPPASTPTGPRQGSTATASTGS